MREFEVRFLEIDVKEIQNKLEKLGAKFISDEHLQELIFDKPDRSWHKQHKRVRIRKAGDRIELTYKELIHNKGTDGTEEIEFEVDDMKQASKFLEKLGLVMVREQEKRRITYKLDEITFDIDFWPELPPYIEIESTSEKKVKKGAEMLDFNWEDACFLDAKEVYIQIYKFKDFDNIKKLTFDDIQYHTEEEMKML